MKVIFENTTEIVEICNVQLLKCKIVLSAYDRVRNEYIKIKRAEYKLKSWWYRNFCCDERDFVYTENFRYYHLWPHHEIEKTEKIIKGIVEKCIPLIAEGTTTIILEDEEVTALSKMICKEESQMIGKLKDDYRQHLNLIIQNI